MKGFERDTIMYEKGQEAELEKILQCKTTEGK